jgi:hypothetical protein
MGLHERICIGVFNEATKIDAHGRVTNVRRPLQEVGVEYRGVVVVGNHYHRKLEVTDVNYILVGHGEALGKG